MHSIIRIIVLAVILLIFLRLFLPKSNIYEYFSESIINNFNNSSTVLYSQTSNDTDYMNKLKNREVLSELLIMNRCIEFTEGSIETTISALKSKNDFYISDKIVVQYADFSDIETSLTTKLKELYINSKIDKFLGPIYVLITQYPKHETVSSNCTVEPNPLKENTNNSFSPIDIVGSGATLCNIDTKIDCEIYILMPSHKQTGDLNKVGETNGKTWDGIKSAMSVLLEVPTAGVINTRSSNSKCFTTCGNVANQYAYICGAKNRSQIDSNSYKSIVLNEGTNNNNDSTTVDIANLYVIDTNVMNGIICPSISGGCLSRGTDVQPISLTESVTTANSIIEESCTDNSVMTAEQEICYAKRYGITGDTNDIRYAWNMRELTGKCNKSCSPEFLPITDEQLKCYMYDEAHKTGKTINSDSEEKARHSYFEKYKRGESVSINCPSSMDDTKVDCYKNRYRLDMSNNEAKEQWRTKGFYEGKINSCDLQEGDGFYKTLTPEEAKCYQKNTDSLRNNTNLTVKQLQNHWLNTETSDAKDKECKTVPEMTDEEADCYINRNTDLRGKDPKTHWKEFGFYENRSKSCSDGLYKSLTKEEATCYKRRTDSLRETDIDYQGLNNSYFDGSLEGKDKTCINVPRLSNTEKGCYLNKNRQQLEIDKNNGFDISDPQKHYEERGVYIGLTPDCENGRYVTINNSEAICYKNNNNLDISDMNEIKNHWYDIGFIRNLSKRCPNIRYGARCDTNPNSMNNCKYCSGGVSTRHRNGLHYCGYYRECQRCNNGGHCNSVCPKRDGHNHKCANGNPNDCHCRTMRGKMCGRRDIFG